MSMDLDVGQIVKTGERHRDVDDIGERSIAGRERIELDVPTLAATLSQRLRATGLPVTPDQAVTFAQAVSLVGPVSVRQLYCTARAVFVSDRAEQPAFDRVFDSVFGCVHSQGRMASRARAPQPSMSSRRSATGRAISRLASR